MLRRTLLSATPMLQGIGLHTGAPGWVRLLPTSRSSAVENHSRSGIVFQPASSDDATALTPALVSSTRRCTTLEIRGRALSTVEHLLAAVSGSGLTDVVIEFDGPEVPAMDGSALEFCRAIENAGTRQLSSDPQIQPFVVNEPLTVSGRQGEHLHAIPSDTFSVTVVLDYPERSAIGATAALYDGTPGVFRTQIAPARTYGFLSEFEQVRRLGLASGASLDNCVALTDDGSADERTPLRFPNELARHKLLDVVGDLALAGRPVQAMIVAVRPSHTVNCMLAERIASAAA